MSSPNQTPLVLRGIFARPELQYSNWVATRKITHHTSSDEFSSRFSKTMGAHSENDGVRKNLEIFPKDSRHRSAFLAAVILEIFVRDWRRIARRVFTAVPVVVENISLEINSFDGACYLILPVTVRDLKTKKGESCHLSQARTVGGTLKIISQSFALLLVFFVVVLFRIVHVFTGKNILCYMSKNLTQWKVLDSITHTYQVYMYKNSSVIRQQQQSYHAVWDLHVKLVDSKTSQGPRFPRPCEISANKCTGWHLSSS